MTRTRRLAASYTALAAALAVLFALNLFWGSVSLAPGAVLAWAFEHSGTLWTSIALHAAVNALSVLALRF